MHQFSADDSRKDTRYLFFGLAKTKKENKDEISEFIIQQSGAAVARINRSSTFHPWL